MQTVCGDVVSAAEPHRIYYDSTVRTIVLTTTNYMGHYNCVDINKVSVRTCDDADADDGLGALATHGSQTSVCVCVCGLGCCADELTE